MLEQPRGKREGRRVALDDNALKKITHFCEELKKAHCRATHSQVVSMALNIFFESYLTKERSKFEKSFFDRRSYLKSMLNESNSEEEITHSIKTFLKKIEGASNRNKKKEL